jgi:hypothetical protein
MKKIVKTETKTVNTEVTLCDTCDSDRPFFIRWKWSFNCKYDDCYSDYGECHFCSVACLKAGAAAAMDHFNHKDDVAPGRFEIEFDGHWCPKEQVKELMELLSGSGNGCRYD